MIFEYPQDVPPADPIETFGPLTWHILLVDDDEDDYLITRSHLRDSPSHAIDLVWADSFESGLEHLRDRDYDAVLVDYDLGKETGIHFIRTAMHEKAHVPMILYTGRGGRHVDLEAMEVGATLYLTKVETNPLLLERSIRYAIERKQTERDLRHSQERYYSLFAQFEDLLQKRVADLAHTKELFEQLFQSAPDATLLVRADGGIRRANAEAQRMFGYSEDELLERNVEALMPPRFRGNHSLLRIAYLEHPTVYRMGQGGEILAQKKSGEEFSVDVMLNTIDLNGELNIICMIREA